MKFIRTLAVILFGLLFTLFLDEREVGAGNLSTTFVFVVQVGETRTEYTTPTSPGKRLILPVAFDNWNCVITPTHMSDDGSAYYENIACSDTASPVVFGASVECPIQKEGGDVSTLFLRAGVANVTLMGLCRTRAVSSAPTAPPAPTTHL
jgi:hypothetical protein